MIHVLVAMLMTISLQDQFDGAEIGDASQSMTFESGGKYVFRRTDPKGETTARGTWKTGDTSLEVKVLVCKGPSCGHPAGRSFKADIGLVSDRAMTVKADPPDAPLSTGSYYCNHQGCEKRAGIQLDAHGAKPLAMKYLLDYLIDKNHGRDQTVVWWTTKRLEDKQDASKIEYCSRDSRGKQTAMQLAQDLAALPWVGSISPQDAGSDCLFDVRLTVADGVQLPAKK